MQNDPVLFFLAYSLKILEIFEFRFENCDVVEYFFVIRSCLRMSKMATDAIEGVLGMLQAAGVATEVESGFWARSQVQRRIKPSSPTSPSWNNSGQEATDLYRNGKR